MKRFAVIATIVLCASPAIADDEGRACDTSAECGGGLHCIDGLCVAVEHGKVRLPARGNLPDGSTAMLGDGHGYVVPIVVGDVIATAVTGLFVGLSFATASGWFAVASLFPTTLTGPIIHAANGRAGPAVISFIAWASAPPSSVGISFLAGVSTFNIGVALLAGTVTGLLCAVGLTALDAYFARDVRVQPRPSSFSLRPSVVPMRDGVTASLVGTF